MPRGGVFNWRSERSLATLERKESVLTLASSLTMGLKDVLVLAAVFTTVGNALHIQASEKPVHARSSSVSDAPDYAHDEVIDLGNPNVDPASAAAAADSRQKERVAAKAQKAFEKAEAKRAAEKSKYDAIQSKKAYNEVVETRQQGRQDAEDERMVELKKANADAKSDHLSTKSADNRSERDGIQSEKQGNKQDALDQKQAARDSARTAKEQANAADRKAHYDDHKAAAQAAEERRQSDRTDFKEEKQSQKELDNAEARRQAKLASEADQVLNYAANEKARGEAAAERARLKATEHSQNHEQDGIDHAARAKQFAEEANQRKKDNAQEDVEADEARANAKVALAAAKQAASRRRGATK